MGGGPNFLLYFYFIIIKVLQFTEKQAHCQNGLRSSSEALGQTGV
jgi:hypothetical protein